MAKQSRTKTLDITCQEKTWSGTKMKKQEVTELELQDCRSQMPNKQQEKMKKKLKKKCQSLCELQDRGSEMHAIQQGHLFKIKYN